MSSVNSTVPDASARAGLIARYADGHAEVRRALEGATDADLDRRPAPDAWTAREVVHHLADSETRSYVRLRQLLAEDDAVIQGYDEASYAKTPWLRYDRPIAASLAAFGAVRAATVELLVELPEEAWVRRGTHTESGAYTVSTWLELYAAHAHDHADQIRRALRGAP